MGKEDLEKIEKLWNCIDSLRSVKELVEDDTQLQKAKDEIHRALNKLEFEFDK